MIMAMMTRRVFSKKVKSTEAYRKVFKCSIPAPMPGEFLTLYRQAHFLEWLPKAYLALGGGFLVLSAYKLYNYQYWQAAIFLAPSLYFFKFRG